MAESAATPFDMNAALADFLAQWMTAVGPELTDAACAAALPHGLDPTLFAAILPLVNADEAVQRLQQLTQLGMLEAAPAEASRPRYSVQPALRPLLLRHWQEKDPVAYRRANAAAAAHYRAQPTAEWIDLEIAFHELGADDQAGMAHFRTVFERSWQARRFDLVEQLLRYAEEQRAVLGGWACTWLDLHRLRMELVYGKPMPDDVLTLLRVEPADPALAAQALILQAEVDSRGARLSRAVYHYRRARSLLADLGDRLGEARVEEARGLLFVQMAADTGGFVAASGQTLTATGFSYLRHAPFLLYRWSSRRISWLPNLYFGVDYQDWIVTRLLYAAIGAFRQSVRLLESAAPAETQIAQLDLRIRMADLYHRVGEWARAGRYFQQLLQDPLLKADPYRLATLQVGQGRAALAAGAPVQAIEPLTRARETSQRYGDRRLLHQVSALLAEAYWRTGNHESALTAFAAAVQSGQEINDLLSVTRLSGQLEELSRRQDTPPSAQTQIAAILQTVDRHAYIARFPGGWHRFFRALATLVVTPITYLFVTILVIALNGLSAFTELLFMAGPVADLLLAIPLLGGMALSAIWLYELLYVGIGWLFVRGVPVRMLVERQPQYVVLLPESLIIRDGEGNDHELSWQAIEQIVTLDRTIWRTPLALFSRLVVISGKLSPVIEGIVNDYERLQGEILARTATWARRRSFDYSFLRSRTSWITLLGVLSLTVLALWGILDPTGETGVTSAMQDGMIYDLPVSSILFWLGLWTILLFPLVGLARLLWVDLRARRALAPGVRIPFGWSSWLALLGLGLLTLYWIAALSA